MMAHRSAIGWLLACCCLVMLTGCLGYRFGSRTLFRADVRTVHIPIVRSDSFRPQLGVLLSECLQKEVERRTPYKLAQAPTADSVLAVRLTTDTKRVTSETLTDEPRLLETILTVELSWTDRRGTTLIETRFLPPGDVTYYFSQSADFVPEAGMSISVAQQQAAEDLAAAIVDQMEARW